MLIKGDKIKQIEPMKGFNHVGDEFEVSYVDINGNISFCSSFGIGLMSYSEFEKYFKKVEEAENVEKKEKWTDWTFYTDIHECGYFYRTKGKRIEIKRNGIKTRCSCHPDDRFDLDKGLKLAVARLNKKIAKIQNDKVYDEYKDTIKSYVKTCNEYDKLLRTM